jgi:hypothetical protein
MVSAVFGVRFLHPSFTCAPPFEKAPCVIISGGSFAELRRWLLVPRAIRNVFSKLAEKMYGPRFRMR